MYIIDDYVADISFFSLRLVMAMIFIIMNPYSLKSIQENIVSIRYCCSLEPQ